MTVVCSWEARVAQPAEDGATLEDHAEPCMGGVAVWAKRPRLRCVLFVLALLS